MEWSRRTAFERYLDRVIAQLNSGITGRKDIHHAANFRLCTSTEYAIVHKWKQKSTVHIIRGMNTFVRQLFPYLGGKWSGHSKGEWTFAPKSRARKRLEKAGGETA